MPRPFFDARRALPRGFPARTPHAAPADALSDLAVLFANPGALRMRAFVPSGVGTDAPLVVVLHGCTQTAAGYDHAAGWSRLATTLGFALLFPEQTRANNANTCFNWFEPSDTRRGSGEVASTTAAVAAIVAQHRLNPARVFVTGLSAGGAMANALLATYPDVFAGGAIIAGLPFGVAGSVGEAMAAMAQPPAVTAAALGDKIRAASTFAGPWPRVTIWHGTEDRTVARANGRAIAAQWADVHGARAVDVGRWVDAAGTAVVELNEVAGMGHGTPVDRNDGGVPAPFMLDVGIDSSARIAAFWGLGSAPRTARAEAAGGPAARPATSVVADALRAAGLLR